MKWTNSMTNITCQKQIQCETQNLPKPIFTKSKFFKSKDLLAQKTSDYFNGEFYHNLRR